MTSIFSQTGIVDISIQLSKYYCDVKDLAVELDTEADKLTIGLELNQASCCAVNEDAVSLGLSAVKKLLEKNNLNSEDIGRLEVGTESNWDGCKSFKTYLMDLFKDNPSINGCDTYNACYGGTNALLNAINWTESTFWNGKYAIVVCTDTSFYNENSVIPLAGSAACAILIGKNPILAFNIQNISHFFKNTFDFTKPKTNFPFSFFDGKLSIDTYKKSFNFLYEDMVKKSNTKDFYDYICFHCPYPKLPKKILMDHDISFKKVEASLLWARDIGNSYCSSIYICLASLLNNSKVGVGENILMFSFGSGTASSMFLLQKVKEGMDDLCDIFKERVNCTPKEFIKLVQYKGQEVKHLNKTKGFVIKDQETDSLCKNYDFIE